MEFRPRGQGAPAEDAAGERARLTNRAWQVIAQTPEMRPAMVAPLAAAIEQGAYRVDARELAHRLMPLGVVLTDGPGWPLDCSDLNLAPLLALHPSLVPELLTWQGSKSRNVRESISTLIMTLEARDSYSGLHCARVTGLALRFARHLGLPPADRQSLKTGGYLHDIGKVALHHAILVKTGAFTLGDRAAMQTHPGYGGKIVAPLSLGSREREIIILHHERWDGQGYPLGLAGEKIPLLCRLVALADVFDALIHDRPYRRRLSEPEALTRIRDLAGVQFDPHLAREFIKMISSHP